jgi:CBS domain-containing protein
VRTVRESDDVKEVQNEMTRAKIRRMPVVDSQDHLVGIVSMGDLAAHPSTGHEVMAESEEVFSVQARVQPASGEGTPQRQTG